MIKLGLAVSFIADKNGKYDEYVKIASAIAFIFVVVTRLMDPKALIINESILYATLF